MSRLQKKCLIATVGMHLFLVLVIVFGAAFFVSHTKVDESQILTVVPTTLIDAAFNQGVKGAEPPKPTPVVAPPQPTPQPPTPKVDPQPKPELEPPQKTLIEKVQEIFKPEPKLQPEDLKPVEAAAKPAPKKIEVNLKPVVRKTAKSADTSEADAKEAQRLRDQKAKAFKSAISSISKNSSTATEVDMPGASSAAYANFKDALATIYYNAWTPPDDTSNDDAITRVRITIARDGTIISARIIGPSGDGRVDASVQRAIDRVSSVPPLPEGKESQRTVTLNFNLKTKRMIE